MDYLFQGRTNILVEPTNPDGSLVLAYHGGYGTPTNFQNGLNIESVLPNSYVLYLDADNAALNLWRAGDNNADVAYTLSILQDIADTYPLIDLTNVHLIGHSNGGMMCYKVAAFLDELNFKTITVISGSYLCSEVFDSTAKVLHIYGDDDSIVPVDGNDAYPPLSETKAKVKVAGTNPRFSEILGAGHDLVDIKAAYSDMLTDIKNHMGL